MANKVTPAPLGQREGTIAAVTASYLIVVALTVSNLVPLRSYIQSHSAPAVISAAIKQAMQVPYLHRVQAKMIVIKAPQERIARKLEFLAASFVIMVGLYGFAIVAAIITFLVQGIRRDPTTIRLGRFPASSHFAAAPFHGIVLAGAALSFWVAIDGLGELAPLIVEGSSTDYIVVTNFAIYQSILFFSGSLLLTLYLVRLALCYIALLAKWV